MTKEFSDPLLKKDASARCYKPFFYCNKDNSAASCFQMLPQYLWQDFPCNVTLAYWVHS
jgi:hypothetical protein